MNSAVVFMMVILSGAPADSGDLRIELERRVALEVEAARRIAEAEEHYRRGLALARAGRQEDAASEFRGAEAAVLDAGEEAYFETALRTYLHELRERLAEQNPRPGTSRSDEPGAFPAVTIDSRTRAWLASAVKQPVPEEAELRAIFRSRGVPDDLIYLGLVESGYRPGAVSPAGAVGPWQFMPETARRYGLKQGAGRDERRDLLKSARAAAEYLRDLYALLGDWTLALAGYNAGEYRVLRAMQKTGITSFWGLRHLLPSETAEYVPRVLAAIRMARGSS
jgi:soluble lytic murein transglycosylase-like protein